MAAAGYKGETDNGNGYGIQDTEKKGQEEAFGYGFNIGYWKRILEQRIISFNFQVYFLRFSWIVRDRF